MFHTLVPSVRDFFNCQVAQASYFHYQKLSSIVLVSSLLAAEKLHISNIILISIGSTFLVLVCFDLILEMDVHNFSQYACLPSFLTRNFSFQLCFDFAMHYGSLYCPYNINQNAYMSSI